MRWVFTSICFLLFISASALDQPDVKAEREYCEMVALFQATHGEAGWPAFKGTEMCHHE